MATESQDYPAVLRFLSDAKLRDCFIRVPALPEPLRSEPGIPYLCSGLASAYEAYRNTGDWIRPYQAFVSGWHQWEGVMLIHPEDTFDADLRVTLAANNERALRDLLLSFPRGKTGWFYCSSRWMLDILNEVLDGYELPSREGYFATSETFAPSQPHPVIRVEREDYEAVQTQWSREVFEEVMRLNYGVHACHADGELRALCFQWEIGERQRMVHGLQAVKDGSYAESVFSSATREVQELGDIALCTVVPSHDTEFTGMLERLGYRPFYRVHSYLGVKRGSGFVPKVPPNVLLQGRRIPRKRESAMKAVASENAPVIEKKDPILDEFRELTTLKGRTGNSRAILEGLTIVGRALNNGLPVERILYTPKALATPEGMLLLAQAHAEGVPHHRISDGLMGVVTTTRPLPPILASLRVECHEIQEWDEQQGALLLIADGIANPDNLGMVLRTADASGADAVILAGEKANPFHKNCIRAARGAIGRIPLYHSTRIEQYLRSLREADFHICGATAKAHNELYDLDFHAPVAFIVGNEQDGVRLPILDVCTHLVRIPMAPGQDSLNVGVAAGVLLYEAVRRQIHIGG